MCVGGEGVKDLFILQVPYWQFLNDIQEILKKKKVGRESLSENEHLLSNTAGNIFG